MSALVAPHVVEESIALAIELGLKYELQSIVYSYFFMFLFSLFVADHILTLYLLIDVVVVSPNRIDASSTICTSFSIHPTWGTK